MVRSRAEVRHHHEPPHPGLTGGVDHPDRGIAVDGIGAGRVAAARACGEDHRVVACEQIGQPVGI